MTGDIASISIPPRDFNRRARRLAVVAAYSVAFIWSFVFGNMAIVSCVVTWMAFESELKLRFEYAEVAQLMLMLWLLGLLATYLFGRLERRMCPPA